MTAKDADAVAKRGGQPEIWSDFSIDDEMLKYNRRFHEHLHGFNFKSHYVEFNSEYDLGAGGKHCRSSVG